MTVVINLLLGLFPTFALAWSIAADERKPPEDRAVTSDDDRRRRRTMFLLVYGLWLVTLAMWNWMRSAPAGWIIAWSILGVGALVICYAMRKPGTP